MLSQGLLLVILILCVECSSRTIVEYCPRLPTNTLTVILGSAYNSRYMSIDEPSVKQQPMVMGSKRALGEEEFFVDNNFHKSLSDQPAWEVEHIAGTGTDVNVNEKRKKRSSVLKNSEKIQPEMEEENVLKNGKNRRDSRQLFLDSVVPVQKDEIFRSRPWECQARIRWMDLGYDYFPRYLRTVECTKKECWYGHFTCKPRSFTVKVLRRRNGECTRVSQKLMMASVNQITGEFTELWIWEEKAVNFCCDCVMS